MKKLKNKTKTSLLSLSLLSIILLGVLSSSISASATYQLNLSKGTDEFTVDLYNDADWKTTVDPLLTTSDWFGGEADVTNAKSKITLKGWATRTWTVYDVLTSIIMPEFLSFVAFGVLSGLMIDEGFNETYINESYNNNFSSWFGLRAIWSYTTQTYEEKPSTNDIITILDDPSDSKTMLDDYNTLATELNANPVILASPFSFPNVSADGFLWALIFSGLAIAGPQADYLNSLVAELGCENVTVSGSTLIIERYGLTNYTVEISYGEKGMMSSFTVKDLGGTTIYQITSSNSDWVFYLILIIVAVSVVALVAFLIIRKKKLRK
jgi:hypothetical protein